MTEWHTLLGPLVITVATGQIVFLSLPLPALARSGRDPRQRPRPGLRKTNLMAGMTAPAATLRRRPAAQCVSPCYRTEARPVSCGRGRHPR